MKRVLVSTALALALAAPAAFAQPDRYDPAARHMHERADRPAMGAPDRPDASMKHRHWRARHMAPGMGLLGLGHGPLDHVEGRIAFLRAELAITPAQGAAWDAFADALRANAKRVAPSAPDGDAGVLARIETAEKRLADRLEGVKATRAALAALQPQLDDAQREMLDELLAPPMRRADRR